MSKKVELKERGTGTVMYPKTVVSNIFDEEAKRLDVILDEMTEQDVTYELVVDPPIVEETELLTRESLKKDLFIDMWNAACGEYGRYNAETGYFELNEITDIDYKEALNIYLSCIGWCTRVSGSAPRGKISNMTNLRTTLPIYYGSGLILLDLTGFAQQNYLILSIRFVYNASNNTTVLCRYAFYLCSKLHTIYGPIFVIPLTDMTATFAYCGNLETVLLNGLSKTIDLQHCGKLSLESVRYMITYAKNTTPFEIPVHPDVYAKLTDEANTEWHQVLIDAVAKNITFATV